MTTYNGTNYAYQYNTGDIVLTEGETQEIIFVYNRTVIDPPPYIPDDPDPEPTPDPEPEPEPEPTPEPPVEPVIPEEPIEIPEEEVPLAEEPEEPIEIPEEEVPLADVPETGDSSLLWMLTTLISALGLAYLTITGKKREENA